MVVVSTVFLTQLLCLLVPCNPKYQLPDTGETKTDRDHEHEQYLANTGQTNRIRSQAKVNDLDDLESPLKHSFTRDLTTKPKSIVQSSRLECYEENPIVKTALGVVEGYRIQVAGGRKICAFEGIPYAEPPIGYLRFRSPVPKVSWKGILKATGYGPQCLQYNVPQAFRTIGKEDCLFLNIYTVSQYVHRPLPVIVFIHGGGFFFGSSATYGPTYFMQRDIVLVTIQYRLGVLGFLSTGDSVCPGNFGLKDQALALKWVHENIDRFGGDPERVTIMGQSAGSAAVHLHMLSGTSRPYFSSAVSLSGVAFNYWSFYDQFQARNLTNVFAEHAGCPTEDSEKLMDCIREMNPVDLVALTPPFLDDWPYPANAFRPSIETTEDNPDPFLIDYPENIYRRNEVAQVPWLVTTTSGEGYQFLMFPFISLAFPNLQRNWEKLALDLVDAENLDIDQDSLVKKLTRFYFKRASPEHTPIHTYASIVTDRMFHTGIYEAARAHVQVAPTYSYIFDVNGKYNVIVNYGYPASEWGVGHSEDVFYMFNATQIYDGFQREDLEFDVSRTLVNLIANFAEKGVPVYTTEEGEDIEVWLPHEDRNNLRFLSISNQFTMIDDPLKRRMKFWRSLKLPDSPANILVDHNYHNSYV